MCGTPACTGRADRRRERCRRGRTFPPADREGSRPDYAAGTAGCKRRRTWVAIQWKILLAFWLDKSPVFAITLTGTMLKMVG